MQYLQYMHICNIYNHKMHNLLKYTKIIIRECTQLVYLIVTFTLDKLEIYPIYNKSQFMTSAFIS